MWDMSPEAEVYYLSGMHSVSIKRLPSVLNPDLGGNWSKATITHVDPPDFDSAKTGCGSLYCYR